MKKLPVAPYPLRMSPDLRLYLKGKAKESYRSLNKEIISRLEQSKQHEQKNAS